MLTTMVVTSRVAFTGAVNQTKTFGLQSSEYVIKLIDGLGPVKAEYTTTATPTDPGGHNFSGRDTQRNIVITMGFKPLYSTGSTIESLRRALYQLLMPKTSIELQFTDDVLGTWICSGKVETHEPSIFSKDPEVQISILCGDPYFYKTGVDAEVVYLIPEPNPAIVDSTRNYFTMNYVNDVPQGFIFEGTVKGTASSNITLALNSFITNTLPPEGAAGLFQPRMQLDVALTQNQIVKFSSIRYNRGVTIQTGAAAPVNSMAYFSGDLVGMKLQPGPNSFQYTPTAVGGTYPGWVLSNSTIRYKRATGGL